MEKLEPMTLSVAPSVDVSPDSGPGATSRPSTVLRLAVATAGPLPAGVEASLAAESFELVGQAVGPDADVSALVETHAPDALLLDIGLAAHAGFAGLAGLRHRFPELDIVMLSTNAGLPMLGEAFARGACALVVLTNEQSEFAGAIRQAVDATVRAPFRRRLDESAAAREARLTARESEILAAVARGLTNRDIASELWVSEHTVKYHLSNVYRKLGVSSRTEAVRWAFRSGLALYTTV